MSALNWGMIEGGGAFESLVHTLLYINEPSVILFGRPGKDSGQDARSNDGTHVFQAKFRSGMTMSTAIDLAKKEFYNIRKYKDPSHPNFKHWEHVTQWTLIANFQINTSDKSAWNDRVVSLFTQIDIKADYQNLEVLEAELIKHPEICDVFFNGKNRILLGAREAFELLLRTSPGPSFLNRPLLGRQKNMDEFSAFLGAENKPLLIVTGPHGVGKTRFLYDGLLFASEKGWRVFWGLTASMGTSSEWFRLLNSAQPTCVFVDEADSAEFIRRIFEQTAASERKNWKFVLSIQPEYESILPQAGFESLSLNPLSEQESETLSDNCLPPTHPLIKNGQAHHLYSLTQGLPAWQCLLLEECQNKRRFSLPKSFPAFVGKLVQSALKSIPDEIRRHARTMLRWFAAWGVVRIENADSKEFQFLAGKNIPSDCMDEVLSELIKCRLISEWGINGRSHAVEPAIVRQQILSDWLLEPSGEDHQYRITRNGKAFVQELLRFKIPDTPVVLQNLCRMAVSYLPDQASRQFLYPIFEELKCIAGGDSIKDQFNVLELLKRIGHTNADASLDILATLRKRKLQEETVNHGLFGKTMLSHDSLLSSISEYLFVVARDISSQATAQRFLEEIKEYLHFENQGDIRFVNGQEPSNCLRRLIGHPRCANLYFPLAVKELEENWQALPQNRFLQVVLEAIWDPYRETVTHYDRSFCFQRYHIAHPDNPAWKHLIEFRNRAFSSLRDSEADKALRCEIWRQLRRSVLQIDSTRIMEEEDSPSNKLMLDRICDDLQSVLEICNHQIPPIGLDELAEARCIWKPFLNDYKPKELSFLAKECEKRFEQVFEWPVQAMFSATIWEDEQPIDQIVGRLKEHNDRSSWKSFFNAAEQYLGSFEPNDRNVNVSHIHKLVERYSDNLSLAHDSAIMSFADEILRKPSPTSLEREFVIAIGKRLLLQAKQDLTTFSAEQCLGPILDNCSWRTEVLANIYFWPHPAGIGDLTKSEFLFLSDAQRGFSPLQKACVLASFFAVLPDETQEILSQMVVSAKPLSKEQNDLMWQMVQSIYMAGLRYDWRPEQIPVEWVMDNIVQLNIEANILESSPLRWMRETTGWKFSMVQFVQFIQFRIKLETAEKPYDQFSVFPYDFSAEKWCKIGPDDREQKAFDQFCEITAAGGSYISIFQCPKILPKLDPDGFHIAKFAEYYFPAHPTLENDVLCRLAGLVAHYEEGSTGWRAVATRVFERSACASDKDRKRIFRGIQPKSTFTSWSIGTVPKEVEEEVDQKRLRYEAEPADSPVKEYFAWAKQVAEASLEEWKQRAEEERHGDF